MKKSAAIKIIKDRMALIHEVDFLETEAIFETEVVAEWPNGFQERRPTGWEEMVIKIRYKRR